MNLEIGNWRQAGRTCLWRYSKAPRMYGDWHFAADPQACANLLDLLELLLADKEGAHRTLSITDPRTVGVDRIFGPHDLRVDHPEKVRLANEPEDSRAASVTVSGREVVMTLGGHWLEEWASAVRDLAAGEGDFSIGLGEDRSGFSARISFWWWPKVRTKSDSLPSP